MTSIDQLIGELLVRHNCVIIPSFGGFVAKAMPAKIDFQKGVMLPPSKSLLFNKQLINNDGLLINELATNNGLTFDEATIQVREKIASWNDVLKTGGRIELDKVGYLFFDAEKNICFEQDRFFNLLLQSFGLGQVQFLAETKVFDTPTARIVESKVIELKETQKASATIIELTPEFHEAEKAVNEPVLVQLQPKNGRRPVWKYVAAACLLPIAFYSFWIPMKTDVLESGLISIKDFNPFYTTNEGSYHKDNLVDRPKGIEKSNSLEEKIQELPQDVNAYSYKIDNSQYVLVKLDQNNAQNDKNNLIENVSNDTEIAINSMDFIVGCFSSAENAQNLVNKLKANGLSARIVDNHGGLHRVSAGSAISVESFETIKSKAESLGFKGWILK